jgi:ligand-binding SRPBCC domain-containing protein
MVHVLKQTQFLPIDISVAWNFFSRPEHLNEVTPPDLSIEVKSELPTTIYPGLMISYKVSPFKGVRLNWLTEITHANEPDSFVDEQREGPFALWHHEHHFMAAEGGTEMTDIVHYELPFGRIGNLFHKHRVLPKLNKIFNYRKDVLGKRFG